MTYPMEVVTRRMMIQGVPARWLRQYKRDAGWYDIDKQRIYVELLKLDLDTCTAADIARVIGNDSWTQMRCMVCDEVRESMLELNAEHNYDEPYFALCRVCFADAAVKWDAALEASNGPR